MTEPEDAQAKASMPDDDTAHLPSIQQQPAFGPLFRKCFLILWGVVAPAAFLVAASTYGGDLKWQDGKYGTYALQAYLATSMVLLYPLLVFSAASLVTLVFRKPEKPLPGWIVLGVLTGAVLWFELYVAWCLGVSHEFSGASCIIVTVVVAPLMSGFSTVVLMLFVGMIKSQEPKSWQVPIALLFGGLVLASFVLPGLAMLVLLVALVCAAPLALGAYGWASWEILKAWRQRMKVSIAALLIAFAWLSLNFAAWRYAILRAIEEYRQLPTEPPDYCFIATAAARGHTRFVGSRDVGQSYRVTSQLEYLKAFELLLRSTCPLLHRLLRQIYDRVGPAVARRIRSPWLADTVYLLLKPAEWVAWIVLRCMAGVPRKVIRNLYRRS